MLCYLRGGETTFLPSMRGRRGKLRDSGWTGSLCMENLILMTELGEKVDRNRKYRSCMIGKAGALSGGKWEINHSQEADGTCARGLEGERSSRRRR